MPWTVDNIPDQTGRVAVITGANSGLGLDSTKALAKKGALVVMACRSLDKAESAAAEVRAHAPEATVEVRALDLSSFASIEAFAASVLADHGELHLLLNNAGVMAIPRRETADGLEMQLGTNHFGHFALTGRLFDRLLATDGSRIVNVASTAHKTGKMDFDDLMAEQSYSEWGQYGRSKLANLLFTYALDRRLRDKGAATLTAAAHPGYAATNLQHVGPSMSGSRFMASVMNVGNSLIAQPSDMGALPQLFAATDPSVEGGDYIGPDGILEVRGYPTKVDSNARSKVVADQERLWAISEELTGVRFEALA